MLMLNDPNDLCLCHIRFLTCFFFFTPLQELNGKLCIICPNHKYKITLAQGEGIYKATNPKEKPPVARWYSKGLKQRTHTVIEKDGDVYVKLSDTAGWLESDYYQGEKGKLERERAAAAEAEKKTS